MLRNIIECERIERKANVDTSSYFEMSLLLFLYALSTIK